MRDKLKRSYRVASELGKRAEFRGAIPLASLTRLAEQLIDDGGEIQVRFEFVKSRFETALIRGHLATELQMECQRCLEPMSLQLDQAFELLIDASEADAESFGLDSVTTEDGYLDVFTLIEDEIILSLPIIVMHDESSCNRYWQPETDPISAAERDNPFAALAALKAED